MIAALEYDERLRGRFKVAPLAVGAGEMDLQRPEPRGGGIEHERNRIGDEPLGAVADQEPEHALPDQRVKFRQVLVSMERGFVQGGLVARSCGPFRRKCEERDRLECSQHMLKLKTWTGGKARFHPAG